MSVDARAHRGGARVAIVVSQLGYGGAERQTALLLERLVDHPLRPALVCCLSDQLEPYGSQLESLGYRVVPLARSRSLDLG
ncbi:MAG: hypothetical protein JSV80_15070 [Acidobacteriota bacterium]|nr:MAG: hypothetical protein JSV80_15070 [Acidobacteriota bacterium]